MLEIKHTLCPSCSVGCGINVVLKDENIVGTFPYKRHPVNEGKNCLNGRNSIECFKNKIVKATISNSEADVEKAIELEPENGNHYTLQAILLERIGKKEAAKQSRYKAAKYKSL